MAVGCFCYYNIFHTIIINPRLAESVERWTHYPEVTGSSLIRVEICNSVCKFFLFTEEILL